MLKFVAPVDGHIKYVSLKKRRILVSTKLIQRRKSMGIWGIITWIVVGGLAGWVASKIAKTDASQGIVGNIVVGIIGAFVGGFLVELFGGTGFTGFNIWSFLVALLGAVVVLFIWRAITGRRAA